MYTTVQTYLNTTKQRHFGLLDNSGPIQVELTYSSIIAIVILLNIKYKKMHTYLECSVNKTVTNTLHGTNFQASNSRKRHLYTYELTWVSEYNEVPVFIYPCFN